MTHLDGTLKTDEMSLAALLSVHGYCLKMVLDEEESNHVFWVLSSDEVDEFVHELVEDFRSGASRVEPKRFTRELRAVRRGLYDFIGHKGTPVKQ